MIIFLSVFFFIWFVFLFVVLTKLLREIYLWQIKEFRLDRYSTFIFWDQQKNFSDKISSSFKFLIFSLLVFAFNFRQGLEIILSVGILVYFYIFKELITSIYHKEITIPSYKNYRNIIIFIFIFLALALLMVFINFPVIDFLINGEAGNLKILALENLIIGIIWIIFLDISMPFLVGFFVLVTEPISYFRRKFFVYYVSRRLEKTPNLKIIGITGSQGKTTQKEILYELLSRFVKVEKTYENMNTEFGVAKSIKNYVKKNTKYFVAEMGAYKSGEIAGICKYFKPYYSIITDVDYQHIGIFGSKSKLARAKFEIIKKKNRLGFSIINADRKLLRDLSLESNRKIYYIFSSKTKYIKFLKTNQSKGKFTFLIEKSKLQGGQSINISGGNMEKYNFILKNHLAQLYITFAYAVIFCIKLGINVQEVLNIVNKLEFNNPRLEVETGDNNSVVVNKTYNSSRKGLLNSVSFMNRIWNGEVFVNKEFIPRTGKRILVTKGIFELGHYKKEVYKTILNKIGKKIDEMITTDSLFLTQIKKYNLPIQVNLARSNKEMIDIIRKNTKGNDIILLEGKLKPEIIANLISKKY